MLSARQQEIYEFICQFVSTKSYSPTIREIGAQVGISSKGVVHRHLQAIAAVGYIEIVPHKRRNIQVKQFPLLARGTLPLLGKIAAGRPIEAIEEQQALDLSALFMQPDYFALTVVGDSMIEVGIFDGDYVICQRAQDATNKAIVVALIDQEEATLKRISYESDGSITLIPENTALQPINYSQERVRVQGIYKGIIRIS